MQSHKELDVWKKSMELTTKIYRITKLLPDTEKFGLITQMRRCCVSIPSNIAEVFGRKFRKENARFVGIAYSSGLELETQISICKNLEFIPGNSWNETENILSSILKMLFKYREYLLK